MSIRKELGDFSSIVCFKAVVVGAEEALGERAAGVALKSAGRKRGRALVEGLGLSGSAPEDLARAAQILDDALGPQGTRLCRVRSIERDGVGFVVRLSETICSAGEPLGSPRRMTFTFGALHGAMEALFGTQLRGAQVESVLAGGAYDAMYLGPRDVV